MLLLVVAGERILDVVREAVLGMGIVLFGLDKGGGRSDSDGYRVDTDGDGGEHDEDLRIFLCHRCLRDRRIGAFLIDEKTRCAQQLGSPSASHRCS